jgi:tetratricopeptide (TPR) repeat protein
LVAVQIFDNLVGCTKTLRQNSEFNRAHWCWQSYKELGESDKAIECLQKAVALDGKYDYRTQYLKTQNGCYLYLVYRTHLLAHFTFAREEHHDGTIF